MTWALCFNCGATKFGTFHPCPECGITHTGDMDLDLAFTDHYLSRESLEQFGAVVQAIRRECEDDGLRFWSFLYYASSNHPDILQVKLSAKEQERCADLLARANPPKVTVQASWKAEMKHTIEETGRESTPTTEKAVSGPNPEETIQQLKKEIAETIAKRGGRSILDEIEPQRLEKEQRQHRRDLGGEHPLGDAGQLVLACLFFTTWVADTFVLQYTTWLNQYVPLAIRIPLGVVLLVVSGYLAATGLSIVFGEKREGPGVIRKSVFGIIRHPIYLSEIVLYLGLLVTSLSLAATVVWGITILFLHHISRYEERLLLARFGEEYAQYMREVPMWVPRLRRKRQGEVSR